MKNTKCANSANSAKTTFGSGARHCAKTPLGVGIVAQFQGSVVAVGFAELEYALAEAKSTGRRVVRMTQGKRNSEWTLTVIDAPAQSELPSLARQMAFPTQ